MYTIMYVDIIRGQGFLIISIWAMSKNQRNFKERCPGPCFPIVLGRENARSHFFPSLPMFLCILQLTKGQT